MIDIPKLALTAWLGSGASVIAAQSPATPTAPTQAATQAPSQPASKPAPAAKPAAAANRTPSNADADAELLEFLGSIDAADEDADWLDYLMSTDIARLARNSSAKIEGKKPK